MGCKDELLMLALAYINYVQSEQPQLHGEANGTPPIKEAIVQYLKEKKNV